MSVSARYRDIDLAANTSRYVQLYAELACVAAEFMVTHLHGNVQIFQQEIW
jgi:hypothetical protein